MILRLTVCPDADPRRTDAGAGSCPPVRNVQPGMPHSPGHLPLPGMLFCARSHSRRHAVGVSKMPSRRPDAREGPGTTQARTAQGLPWGPVANDPRRVHHPHPQCRKTPGTSARNTLTCKCRPLGLASCSALSLGLCRQMEFNKLTIRLLLTKVQAVPQRPLKDQAKKEACRGNEGVEVS